MFGRISCLRALILNPVSGNTGGVGRGKPKILENRVKGSGSNLVGKISTSPRYMIDLTGLDLFSLGELGGGHNYKQIEKMRHF